MSSLKQWYQSNLFDAKFQEDTSQRLLQATYSNYFQDQTLIDYLYYFSDYIYYKIWQSELEVVYSEKLLNLKDNLKTANQDIFLLIENLTQYLLSIFNEIEKNANQLFTLNPKKLKISGTYYLSDNDRNTIKTQLLPALSRYYLSICYVDICSNRYELMESNKKIKITRDNFSRQMLDLEIEKYKRLKKLTENF